MIDQIIVLILVTFIPALELRASIPLGILTSEITLFNLTLQGFGLPLGVVLSVCILSNIFLGILVYLILNKFIHFFLKFRLFENYYNYKIRKVQKKIKPSVDKYGIIGLAFFIGLPIPGSGSYTGALVAHILGMDYKKFILANIIGVIMAGILVTIITFTGIQIFSLFA